MPQHTYTLKSGTINFQNDRVPNSYGCIVIKDGKFHNMSPDMKEMLLEALEQHGKPDVVNTDDMFNDLMG